MGCHALLQGIFPTQQSNLHLLCLLHWQAGSFPLVLLGSPPTSYSDSDLRCLNSEGFEYLLRREVIAPEILLLCTLEEGALPPKGKYFLPKVCFVLVLNRFSHVLLFVTPQTAACQVSLSMGFPSQKYWSGLPCPPPNPRIEPMSLMSLTLAESFFTTKAT